MTRRKTVLWLAGLVLGCVALVSLGGWAILQSRWFRDQVRRNILSTVADVTGGRVEAGAFRYDWRTWTASVNGLVVHGTEGPGEPVLFRAERIEVGLRMASLLNRQVDLASLTLEQPRISIRVAADGHSNLPGPVLAQHAHAVQRLLDLKIRRMAVQGGRVQYNSREIPLDGQAEDVNAQLRFDPKGAKYVGEVASHAVQLNSPGIDHARFDFLAKVALGAARLEVPELRVVMGKSRVDAAGVVEDMLNPRASFEVQATLRPEDVNDPFRIPIEKSGEVRFTGTFHAAAVWELKGRASAKGLAYRRGSVDLVGIGVESPLVINGAGLDLVGFTASGLGGTMRGKLSVPGWRRLVLEAEVQAVSVRGLAVSGPVTVDTRFRKGGFRDAVVGAQLRLEGAALRGSLNARYEQARERLVLGESEFEVGTSRASVSGTLGEMLTVRASTRNFKDLETAAALVGETGPKDLPVTLRGGEVKFDGTVSGALRTPVVAGHLSVTSFEARGERVDRLDTNLEASAESVSVSGLTLVQGALQVQGSGRASLAHWQIEDGSAIGCDVAVHGAEVSRLFPQVKGMAGGTARIHGTWAHPEGTAEVDGVGIAFQKETLDRVTASLTMLRDTLRVDRAHAGVGTGQIEGNGIYEKDGRIQFRLSGKGVPLAKVQHVQDLRAGAGGSADWTAQGTASWLKNEFRVVTIVSQGSVRQVTLDGQRYGDLKLSANSRGNMLEIRAQANLFGNTPVQGSGEWKLEGDDPGHGEIVVPRMTVASLHALIPNPVPNPARTPLPFEGFVEGRVSIDGPLRKPDQMKAAIRIDVLQINASASATPRAGAKVRDLVLRNARPIELEATSKGVEVRAAQLSGIDTTLEAQGRFAFDSKNPWDVRLKGSVNLAVMQIFNPNLLGAGISVVDAVIRGSRDEPQVEGRLEVKNASLFVTDLPNGLEQANGVILFDRNRATVDGLTATTGGGRVTLQKGSYVGFRGAALVYRVQGAAERVRYRSPEGVSLTVNAALSLIGTSDNSLLSGTVTVVRAGFNPTTDVGELLANTARPLAAAAPNDYLRGMQLDVRVESAQSLEIQTSLTRNIDAVGNLRVRGTPERPVVLGNLTVNQGEIEFFGNKYRINRGEVNFYNPVKIDPVLDMDLETVVRGITVDIAFSGGLSKLNFSYRSDPPLQTNEIIALLAVGRTPATTGALTPNQTASTTNYLSTGTNALLSQAIAAPAAGRLQRFFGVSHIKIDPQLTDVTAVPQARVTLEQQISKDITLTYITNLTRTQEQIVRVEWDLNRQWSVIALRDENGAFGIDFQFRKRFK